MPRLQRSQSLKERNQGRRALKNGHLPLILFRAFSGFLEWRNQKGLLAENQRIG
jgi:hypothetical protein